MAKLYPPKDPEDLSKHVDDIHKTIKNHNRNFTHILLTQILTLVILVSYIMYDWTDEQIEKARRTKDNKEEVLAYALNHLDVFAKLFFPERFPLPFDKPHYQVIEALDDFELKSDGSVHYPNKKIVIVMSRGMGKSSLLLAHKARKILFRLSRFSPWVGYSETHAVEWTENLKTELMASQAVRDFGFGSIRTAKVDMGDGKKYDQTFSKKSWTASYPGDDWPTLVLPRGSGQQIRGVSFNQFRPDDMLFDDFEDSDEIENEDQRKKLRSKFYGSHLKATPQQESAEWQIVYVDTIKHEDALITHLLDDASWVRINAPLCDEHYNTNAPSFKSSEAIAAEAKEYDQRGEIDTFAREVLCTSISKKHAAFKEDYFNYYTETTEEFKEVRRRLRNVLLVDPAKTANLKSAYSAFVVWGIDPTTNYMYVRNVRNERVGPTELYNISTDMATSYNCFIVAVEETGLNDFISVPFKNHILSLNLNILYHPLKAKKGEGEFAGRQGGKKARIAQMLPYFEQGRVLFNQYGGAITTLKLQLLGFPRSKYWDAMDCAAYINPVMGEYDWYFVGDDKEDEHVYEDKDEYDPRDMSDTLSDYDDPRHFFF